MRAHSPLRLGALYGTTPELLASPWYCAWGLCMVWEAGPPTRRPLLPLNAGTAEPVRVSPPEAVAYLLELALGETPNLAARLQGLAAPNTLVISATTFQLLGGFFTCQPLGT